MIKIAKGWLQLIDGCFLIITGFSIMDATITLATYSLSELFTIDKVGSLVVSLVVVCFWVLRYRLIKIKNKKEERLLDLEIKIKEMQLERKDMEGEFNKLLENDSNSRNL